VTTSTPRSPGGTASRSASLQVGAVVLSAALVLSAAILGFAFVEARSPAGTVKVVGAATLPFTSDIIKWRVQLVRAEAPGREVEGYARLSEDRERFLAALSDAGVAPGDVSVQAVTTNPVYGNDRRQTGVQLRQTVVVVSTDIEAVESLALDPGPLLRSGLGMEGSQLEYFYQDIAALKHSLLEAASADARSRAGEIVGDRLGSLRESRAGVFQIREPYSTEVQGYGVHTTATRRKEITVTVHATFGLR
jgi:hypothetical protein